MAHGVRVKLRQHCRRGRPQATDERRWLRRAGESGGVALATRQRCEMMASSRRRTAMFGDGDRSCKREDTMVGAKAIPQSFFFELKHAVPRCSSDSQSHGKQASGSIAACRPPELRQKVHPRSGTGAPCPTSAGSLPQRAQNEDVQRRSLR